MHQEQNSLIVNVFTYKARDYELGTTTYVVMLCLNETGLCISTTQAASKYAYALGMQLPIP